MNRTRRITAEKKKRQILQNDVAQSAEQLPAFKYCYCHHKQLPRLARPIHHNLGTRLYQANSISIGLPPRLAVSTIPSANMYRSLRGCHGVGMASWCTCGRDQEKNGEERRQTTTTDGGDGGDASRLELFIVSGKRQEVRPRASICRICLD